MGGSAAACNLIGNTGINPDVGNFLGTTDDVSLELPVNGERALRLEPGRVPNVIGGGEANRVTEGVIGATIGGGGSASEDIFFLRNTVTDSFGTVGGGVGNRAGDGESSIEDAAVTVAALYATVGGGFYNTASGVGSFIVFERMRKAEEEDRFMWFCEKCGKKVYEVDVRVGYYRDDAVSQVHKNFYGDEALRTCKACGDVVPTPG